MSGDPLTRRSDGCYPAADYAGAFNHAAMAARRFGHDHGIEAATEYGRKVLRVKMLPTPQNRYGWELRCEVVTPDAPLMGVTVAQWIAANPGAIEAETR